MMKRVLSVLFLVLAFGFVSEAQVVIINDNLFTGRLSEVRVTVLDSVSREPVSFAGEGHYDFQFHPDGCPRVGQARGDSLR